MKKTVQELAVLGSTPAFANPLHVGRPNIAPMEQFYGYLEQALHRFWLTNDGDLLVELERRIADFLGVRHCIAMCNGTMALEIMARACGLRGEVILPSFTFIATPHALEWLGIRPVFCDVDPATHTLDPGQVQRLVTDQTSAIMGVHLWGNVCDVEGLETVARRNRLVLVFDAAHAFACSHLERMVGTFGLAEAFSFHATKFFNTFEGGAVTTNDDEVAERCRLMRNFGFGTPDDIMCVGINGKMSEASAAMGLANLDSLDVFVSANLANHNHYSRALEGLPALSLIRNPSGEHTNGQYVVIEVDEETAGLSRDDLYVVLRAENVLARRYFHPGCHRQQPYRERPLPDPLTVTERLCKTVLQLPSGTAVNSDDIAEICSILRVSLADPVAVRWALRNVPERA
jgi:dTDP-4-amino-4,6-dideoxygalactose transaminase